MKKSTILFNLFMYSSITLFAETNISGKVFYNYTTNLDKERNNEFNMKRAYLTFANDVSETVSYKCWKGSAELEDNIDGSKSIKKLIIE